MSDYQILWDYMFRFLIILSVFGLIGESLDNYFAKKQKITLLEQWAKQYKIDVPTVWTDD